MAIAEVLSFTLSSLGAREVHYRPQIGQKPLEEQRVLFVKSGRRVVSITLPETFLSADALTLQFWTEGSLTRYSVQMRRSQDPNSIHVSFDRDGIFLVLTPTTCALLDRIN